MTRGCTVSEFKRAELSDFLFAEVLSRSLIIDTWRHTYRIQITREQSRHCTTGNGHLVAGRHILWATLGGSFRAGPGNGVADSQAVVSDTAFLRTVHSVDHIKSHLLAYSSAKHAPLCEIS